MNSLSDIREDADLRRVFGRFPTGVTALCGLVEGRPVGMTASAFAAISLQPALVSVCIKQGSTTWRQLRTRERIGISFLGHGHAAAARQLAQRSDNRFSGLDYEVTADGALFLANATAWLECSVETEIAFSLAGDQPSPWRRVLTISRTRCRGSGALPSVRPSFRACVRASSLSVFIMIEVVGFARVPVKCKPSARGVFPRCAGQRGRPAIAASRGSEKAPLGAIRTL